MVRPIGHEEMVQPTRNNKRRRNDLVARIFHPQPPGIHSHCNPSNGPIPLPTLFDHPDKIALVSTSPFSHKHHALDKFPHHPPFNTLIATPPPPLPCRRHRLCPHPLRLHLRPLWPRLRTRSPAHRLVLSTLASPSTTLRPPRRGENARRVGRKEDGGCALCDVDT